MTTVEAIGDGWIVVAGEKIACGPVVLATGHSARDMYAHLMDVGYVVEPVSYTHLDVYKRQALLASFYPSLSPFCTGLSGAMRTTPPTE